VTGGKRWIAAVFVAVAVVTPALAISLDEVDANASILLIGTYPPDQYGTASPATTQLLGASLPLAVAGPFFLEPVIELFGLNYEWTFDNGTAVPAWENSPGQFYTLGALISLQAGLDFPVSPTVSLGGALGLDFLLRFPVDWWHTADQSTEGRTPSLAYFFGQGRFFYPESRLFVKWQISEPLTLIFNVRAYWPLFHAWDGLGQNFLDQFMLSGGLGIGIKLGSGKKAAATGTTSDAGSTTDAAAPTTAGQSTDTTGTDAAASTGTAGTDASTADTGSTSTDASASGQ
jgi:hypothetical protein